MNHRIGVAILLVAGIFGSANASDKSKEVEEIQKLEKAVQEQMKKGACTLDDTIKAKLLENRARYIAGDLSKKEWLDKERELNSKLLVAQNARFVRGLATFDYIFKFQNELLTTRMLLKMNGGQQKPAPASDGR